MQAHGTSFGGCVGYAGGAGQFLNKKAVCRSASKKQITLLFNSIFALHPLHRLHRIEKTRVRPILMAAQHRPSSIRLWPCVDCMGIIPSSLPGIVVWWQGGVTPSTRESGLCILCTPCKAKIDLERVVCFLFKTDRHMKIFLKSRPTHPASPAQTYRLGILGVDLRESQ